MTPTLCWTASCQPTKWSNVTAYRCAHQQRSLWLPRANRICSRPRSCAIFNTRALVLGSRPDERARPRPLIAQMLSLGWGVLADVPDREIVMGAVTRPWAPNPRFHAIGPGQFAAFTDSEYVKIIWSLRAIRQGRMSR
jgi:hypothetical protein